MLAASSAVDVANRDALRRADLRRMQRRATALLVLVALAFLAVAFTTPDEGGWHLLRSALEGGMVGGLADWFAVTALFRHPLGLPIPHTAVVRARKDQFGRTLGEFVQANFLSAEVLTDRLRAAQPVVRLADHLAEPANAQRLAGHAAEALVSLADTVRDEEFDRLFQTQLRERVEKVDLAPLLARAVEVATAGEGYDELVDATLRGLGDAIDTRAAELRDRFATSSPWWLPRAAEDRIFERLVEGARKVIRDMHSDRNHELRADLDRWVDGLAARLRTDPELAARAEALKQEMLEHPELRRWSASIWSELRGRLRDQASAPESELRDRIATGIAAGAGRFRSDPALIDQAETFVESAVANLATRFHAEITELVAGTIERWDADETSDKLELLLGRDLQFIRINGTIVGALAGLVIALVASIG